MTGRHAAPARATLSWWRLWRLEVRSPGTRRLLRVAIAIIALLTTVFLVLVPRAAEQAYDDALGDRIARAPDGLRDVALRLKVEPQWGGYGVIEEHSRLHEAHPPFDRIDTVARERLGPAFLDLVTEQTHAAQTGAFVLSRRDEPLTVEPPQAVIRIQSALDGRVEWVAGGAPGAPSEVVRIPIPVLEGAEVIYRRVEVVPVGLAQETAELWGLRVGDRLDLSPAIFKRGQDEAGVVDVVGIFRPVDPAEPFWRADGRMLGTAAVPTPDGGSISQGSLFAGEGAYAALSQALQPLPEGFPQVTSAAFEHTWRYRIRDEGLTAADAEILRSGVARLRTATGGWNGDQPSIATGLSSVLDRYARDVQVTTVLTLFAAAGVAALAAFTLMGGVLALLTTRRDELRLIAARGSSRGQLTGLLAGDAAAWVIPPVAVGVGLGVLWGRGQVPWQSGALVGLVVVAPIAVAGWVAHRVAAADRSGELRTVRVRRVVIEVAVLVAAVLLVLQLRERAAEITSGAGDWIAALVPAVVGLAVALVGTRVIPGLVRFTTLLASRTRSAVPLLAAAGQRATAAAVLPIIATVVGTALVTLLATIGLSIAADRHDAAYQRLGADLRIEASRVDPTDIADLAAQPHVAAAVAAFVAPATTLVGGSRTVEVELIAAAVEPLTAVRAGTPVALTGAQQVGRAPIGPDGTLAIALSRELLPDEGVEIRVGAQRIPARVVAVDPALARVVDGLVVDTALVDLAALQEKAPIQATTAFVAVRDRDWDALDAADRLPLERSRQSTVSVVAATAEQATSRLVTATFLGSAVLAAVLLVGAIALLVLATRGSRAVLGHRSAILGMTRRDQRCSELLGIIPVVLLIVLAAAALGSILPRLVGPAIDLTSLTGGVMGHEVPPRPLLALSVGLGAVLLTVLVLVLDRLLLRRRPLTATLREGDQR